MNIQELLKQISGDIASRMDDATVYLRGSLPWVVSRVLSGILSDMWDYLTRLSNEITPLHATQQHLDDWGTVWGVFREQGVKAYGVIRVSGTVGSLIPSGTRWTDGVGKYWSVPMDYYIGENGHAYVFVIAEREGAAENVEPGALLKLVPTLEGIDNDAVVSTHKPGITIQYANYYAGFLKVTAEAGATLPQGSVVARLDGARYIVTSNHVWSHSGPRAVWVEAEQHVESSACLPGTTLWLLSPPSGVSAATVVLPAGIKYGADKESDAQYRARLLSTIRRPSIYGSLLGYKRWLYEQKEVPVAADGWRIWPDNVLGEVELCFTVDRATGIPTSDEIDLVQKYLQERAPAGIRITTVAPTLQPCGLQIRLSVKPQYSVSAVRDNITFAIQRMFRRQAPSYKTTSLQESQIYQAILSVDGVDWAVVQGASNIEIQPYKVLGAEIVWL